MPAVNVRVVARFRPLNSREKALDEAEPDKHSRVKIEPLGDEGIQIDLRGAVSKFSFDHCFWNCAQDVFYDVTAKPVVDDVLKGFNGTIFAYGQTGAGKSFSMFGPGLAFGSDEMQPELGGIIPRANFQIFAALKAIPPEIEVSFKVSFVEIYNEQIQDLLNPENKNLKVVERPSGVTMQDVTEQFVRSESDLFALIEIGNANKSVSFTKMNAESSRSHCLFIWTVEQKSVDESTLKGKLNLIDLAGSEKVGKTGAAGQTLKEAQNINKSLSTLGNCIKALTAKSKTHIPFRDSKLTRLLQDSLGGNTKTTLVVACSPHPDNAEETISTLKFAQRAKTIKNTASANQQRSTAELNRLVTQLQGELRGKTALADALQRDILVLDPSYELPADGGAADGGSAGGEPAGGGGGGGGDPAAMAELRVALEGAQQQQRAAAESAAADERAWREELEAAHEKAGRADELQGAVGALTAAAEASAQDFGRQKEQVLAILKKLKYEKKQLELEVDAAKQKVGVQRQRIAEAGEELAAAEAAVGEQRAVAERSTAELKVEAKRYGELQTRVQGGMKILKETRDKVRPPHNMEYTPTRWP